jgi:hypothetical protein
MGVYSSHNDRPLFAGPPDRQQVRRVYTPKYGWF